MSGRRIRVLMVGLLAGCGYYEAGTPPGSVPTPIDASDRFEIWSGGRATEVRHLAVDADSVRGVRWDGTAACDACRVAIPRVDVDSVRRFVGEADGGEYSKFAIGLVAIFLIVKAFPRPN